MRTMIFLAFVPLLLACSSIPQTSPGNAQRKSPDPITSVAPKLVTGKNILLQGKPDVAIRDYFDPIILDYQSKYSRADEVVYSAHTPVETIIYSAMPAAAAKAAGKTTVSAAKTTVVDGTWVDALQLKGYALVELKQEEEAIAALKQATVLAPLNPTPWNELGYAYQTQMNWTAAMDAYKQAESGAELLEDKKQDPARPLYARALRGQGYVLTELGKLGEAEAIYQRCLQINPDDGNAKHELAYIAQLKQKSVAPPSTPAESQPK